MDPAKTRRHREHAVARADRLRIAERERKLDEALADTFPGSDPVACLQPTPPASESPTRRRR